MVVEPAARLVAMPDVPIVATLILLLLQVPPGVASAREVVPPSQILVTPVMATGGIFTVTGVLT